MLIVLFAKELVRNYMHNIIDQIKSDFFSFLSSIYPTISFDGNPHAFVLNTDDKKKEFGDINSNVALVIAKNIKKNPHNVASEIIERFRHAHVFEIQIVGPGFLNFFFTTEAVKALYSELFLHKAAFFQTKQDKKLRINIEFVSANPTGPLHFGHGRGGIIGDTLSRVFTLLGHEVTKEFYINDAGAQIQKLGESFKARCLQQIGINAAVPEEGYQGDYLVDLASEYVAGNRAITEQPDSFFATYAQDKLLSVMKNTLVQYRIMFDTWFSEKTLRTDGSIKQVLAELRQKGFLYFQDDAWWFCATTFGDDKDRVVERSNGELTYIAADIAYLQNKINRKFDKLIMILGHDHHGYVRRLHASLNALGYQSDLLDVILYQLVKITKEGELVRMSKRAGHIVTLQDIIDTVSADVARFFYLYKKTDSPLEFDLELALKKSEENPVFYLQYAYVRCMSVLKKSESYDEFKNISVADISVITDEERTLLRKICVLKYVLQDIAMNYHTHLVAQATLDIAASFHHYYAKHIILDAENVAQSRSRLFVVICVKEVFELLFDLLGISAPVKM